MPPARRAKLQIGALRFLPNVLGTLGGDGRRTQPDYRL